MDTIEINTIASDLNKKSTLYKDKLEQEKIDKYYEDTKKLVLKYCNQIAEKGKFGLHISTLNDVTKQYLHDIDYIDTDTGDAIVPERKLVLNGSSELLIVNSEDYENIDYFMSKIREDTGLGFNIYEVGGYSVVSIFWDYIKKV